MDQPLTIASWPRAILHMDADAFFASCEQAVNPRLKGKPVVTGKERGIAAAMSYEAKRMGVKRGMRLFEVKKVCPAAIILPSDYETYSLFSLRMFEILRRFTPDVEEYSIDEAFADLTGLRRTFHSSYGEIGKMIMETIEKELGLTVSVGISLSKVLAKIASKWNKPKGLTLIPGRDIHLYLTSLPIESVWGIGPNTAAFLQKFGIRTALDFARKDEGSVKQRLSKPYREVWEELNGRSVLPVLTKGKTSYQSISKTRTFTPPSKEESFIFAQVSRNLENACLKARRHGLAATRLIVFLTRQDFRSFGLEMKLSSPTAYPADLLGPAHEGFQKVFQPQTLFRQTGVVLAGLVEESGIQRTLFDDPVRIEKLHKVYEAVDTLAKKFGKYAVHHAASLPTKLQAQHEGERGDVPARKTELFRGENGRQRLGIPVLRIKV